MSISQTKLLDALNAKLPSDVEITANGKLEAVKKTLNEVIEQARSGALDEEVVVPEGE